MQRACKSFVLTTQAPLARSVVMRHSSPVKVCLFHILPAMAWRIAKLILAFVITVPHWCSAAPNAGEDWPRFLGPRANNISSETGLLDKWPTNGPPLLWEKSVG